jgi:hypothetical protein
LGYSVSAVGFCPVSSVLVVSIAETIGSNGENNIVLECEVAVVVTVREVVTVGLLSPSIGLPPKGKVVVDTVVVVLGSEVLLKLVLVKDFSRLEVVLMLVVVVEAVLKVIVESCSWIQDSNTERADSFSEFMKFLGRFFKNSKFGIEPPSSSGSLLL